MPTNPASGVSFTVKTNGQTLSVAAGVSASSLVQTLYSDAAITASVTTPQTITSDTTYYLPLDMANESVYISCKQPDGTELWGKKQHLGGVTIEPVPSRVQVAAELGRSSSALALAPTGAEAETFSRAYPYALNAAVVVSGRMTLTAVYLPTGATVSTISYLSGTTALSGGTAQWFALYNSSRVLLAQTADDTSTAWGSNTVKTLTLASPVTTTYSGLYYLGINVTASTVPTFITTPASSVAVAVVPILSGSADTGLTTTAPATATTITARTEVPYAYCS
jgi:hypothetical protein